MFVPLLVPDDTLEHALAKFDESNFGVLPVVDPDNPEKLIGLLEQRSVFRMFHERS